MIRKILASPYGVMAVVLCMYVMKVTSKLTIGDWVNSPMIIGDGWHNAADIFEACVVIATIWFSRRPASEEYPLGRKNVESLFSVAVGTFLIGMGAKIGLTSLSSLWNVLNGQPVDLIMGSHLAPWVMSVTGGSALLSLVVSRYQIRVGKKTGHEALVADGEETASDGRVELTTFAGVCGQYLFQAPWIEYPFALVVAGIMLHTGREILDRGMGALLQRTIGREQEQAIRRIVGGMYGVKGVAQLKTFRVGNKAVIILKVLTRAHPQAQRFMKEVMARQIADYLRTQGFGDGEFFIRFDPPSSHFHRRAVLLDSRRLVAGSSAVAATVLICDVEHDRVTRATEHMVSGDLTPDQGGEALLRFLLDKQVAVVIIHDPESIGGCDPIRSRHEQMQVVNGQWDQPAVYGMPV